MFKQSIHLITIGRSIDWTDRTKAIGMPLYVHNAAIKLGLNRKNRVNLNMKFFELQWKKNHIKSRTVPHNNYWFSPIFNPFRSRFYAIKMKWAQLQACNLLGKKRKQTIDREVFRAKNWLKFHCNFENQFQECGKKKNESPTKNRTEPSKTE